MSRFALSHRKSPARFIYFVLGFVILLSSVPLYPQSASAVSVASMTPTEQMKSWLYYNALSVCVSNVALIDTTVGFLSIHNRIHEANALAGKWFDNPSTFASNPTIGYPLSAAGVTVSPSGDKVGCGGDNVAWIKDAISLWGYKDGIDALCDTGAQRANGSNCRDGSGDFKGDHAGVSGSAIGGDYLSLSIFQKNIKDRIYSGSNPTMDDASRYTLARNSFYEGCLGTASPVEYTGTAKDGFLYNSVKVVGTDGVVKDTTFYGKLKGGDSIWYSVSPNGANITSTCTNLVNDMAKYANAFSDYVYKTIKAGKTPTGITPVDCSLTPNDSSCSTTGTSTCAVDGIGWIVCPIMTFLGTINDKAYDFIAGSFLKIDVKLLSPTLPDKSVNPTYSTWGTFRNIANVLFVIVFLIIVFSQMTSAGISSYGVKKMLPRLVIAAILVNISYFVVQIAVDVSNILGYSLKSLFDTLPVYTNSSSGGVLNTIGQGLTWGVIIAGVLAAGVGIALAVSAPVLLAALLSILLTVLILIARQAIIIILIIISPIAFVAWLLPNTEQWFKKWWKMFFSLLMVFPVIGVLFGASKMAATVMQNVGSGSSDILMQVIAMGIASIPLIMTPSLLKGSLSATGALGSKLSGLSSKANSKLGSKVKNESRFGEAMKNRQLTNMRGRAERRARPGGLQSTIDNSRIGRKLGFNAGAARAAQITDAADQEEMKNASSMLSNIRIPSATGPRALRNDEKIKLALGNDVLDEKGKVIVSAKDNHMRRAAIEQAGLVASVSEASSLVDASPLMDATMRKTLSSTLAQSSAVKKAPWLGGRTLGEVENGTANSTESLKRSIASGGITSDTLLGADLDAISKLTSYAKTGYATDQEKSILSSAEADLRNNPNYQGRVATGSDIDNELQKLRQSGPTTSGETFVDLRPGARPTQADFERAESEELERRKNNPPS